MNFLMMGMSLRKDSLNKKLIKNAHRILSADSGEHSFELVSFNDFPLPVYDGDIETAGMPEGAIKLGEKIAQADAIILSTPEYNGGMPGPFKNAVDWVSRITPMPWPGKQLLLIGASPGMLGAVRSLAHSKVPLESIGVFVYPEVMGLPKAHTMFDENGKLNDPAAEERLKKLLFKFRDHVIKHFGN